MPFGRSTSATLSCIEGKLPDFREELVPAAAFGEDTVFELRARPDRALAQN